MIKPRPFKIVLEALAVASKAGNLYLNGVPEMVLNELEYTVPLLELIVTTTAVVLKVVITSSLYRLKYCQGDGAM